MKLKKGELFILIFSTVTFTLLSLFLYDLFPTPMWFLFPIYFFYRLSILILDQEKPEKYISGYLIHYDKSRIISNPDRPFPIVKRIKNEETGEFQDVSDLIPVLIDLNFHPDTKLSNKVTLMLDSSKKPDDTLPDIILVYKGNMKIPMFYWGKVCLDTNTDEKEIKNVIRKKLNRLISVNDSFYNRYKYSQVDSKREFVRQSVDNFSEDKSGTNFMILTGVTAYDYSEVTYVEVSKYCGKFTHYYYNETVGNV